MPGFPPLVLLGLEEGLRRGSERCFYVKSKKLTIYKQATHNVLSALLHPQLLK